MTEPVKLSETNGRDIYNLRTLAIYDRWVLGISNRCVWRCATKHLVNHYNQNITCNHLDVGVGTGYFLDHCKFPCTDNIRPRVVLMDTGLQALDYASTRIQRYHPTVCRHNILEPCLIDAGKFDSVAINFLLHCLPGSLESKAAVFDNLKPLMNPDAVLFGATILHEGISRNWFARRLTKLYNNRGIFCNLTDGRAMLESELGKRFNHVAIRVVGCVAIFSARFSGRPGVPVAGQSSR